MVSKIKWSPRAIVHLEKICTYIAEDSQIYASIFAAKVFVIIKNLPQFPRSGRIVPEYNDPNLREKIYGSYRIVYRVKNDWIEIAAICHGAKAINVFL